MKFLPHNLRQISPRSYGYFILKMFLLFSWINLAKIAILNVFWQKICLGPFGVKVQECYVAINNTIVQLKLDERW